MRPVNQREWKKTACILCECNCGLEVQLGDDGRELVRFRGDKEHPSSAGYACEKPHRLDFYQNDPHRLTKPLRREADGSFTEIDWDTAISEVAERLSKVARDHGGDSIFYYGGGGQGNHLPGAYASATRRALGSRYRSNALAQEKTGEFWVAAQMLGAYTRADFEHCEVALFIGKNPWHSHGIPRARVTLKEIAKDENRTMIVIDPRRSETAAMADIHLQVKPGTDAYLLAAIAARIVEADLVDREFIEKHTTGSELVFEHLSRVPIADFAARCGISEETIERVAHLLGTAKSVATFEDLGVQMNRHSTLVSYLHRLLWMPTGHIGRPGCAYIPTALVPLASGKAVRQSPVVKANIIGGMVPCNVIAEEILSDHPKRYRAMIIEAANPAHSLADSKSFREAMRALDTVVVIDVAMSESAKQADYVLPASSQYEKAEATFFNFEYPENYFHLRRRLVDPPEGPLPEAEIHSRLVEALGATGGIDLEPLKAAAARGIEAYAPAFFAFISADPARRGIAPVILYRTLGPHLPDGLAEGAVLFGAALGAAVAAPKPLARAGFDGPPLVAATKMFKAICDSPSGMIFAKGEWAATFDRLTTADKKIALAIPELLEELDRLKDDVQAPDAQFPFVLSAGERRSFTANTIVRNPDWRRKDALGALRIAPTDAASLGIENGGKLRLTTKSGSVTVAVEISDMMQAGHISLPNGLGLFYPDKGETGTAPNELTSAGDRDPIAGTPWHKHVPARLERIQEA